jgi:hypothetical protein
LRRPSYPLSALRMISVWSAYCNSTRRARTRGDQARRPGSPLDTKLKDIAAFFSLAPSLPPTARLDSRLFCRARTYKAGPPVCASSLWHYSTTYASLRYTLLRPLPLDCTSTKRVVVHALHAKPRGEPADDGEARKAAANPAFRRRLSDVRYALRAIRRSRLLILSFSAACLQRAPVVVSVLNLIIIGIGSGGRGW